MKNNNLRVGDRVIDSDQVYEIFKIDDNRIFYKPIEESKNGGGSTGSIPINNLVQACIRPLLTKPEIKLFLENLACEKPLDIAVPTNTRNNNGMILKDILYLNNPDKTAKLLVYLSNLKRDSVKLSYSDQSIYDQALKHLSDEIAAVLDISYDKAKEKVLTAIKR
jgi:RNA polymerase-interacting CarD/CdnL/TRCF family regulator